VPSFEITVINDEFEASSEQNLSDWESARKAALQAALEVGTESVVGGKPFFAAEIILSDGTTHQRMVVSIGASPLK
jgi:hypothetical protein